MAQSKRDKQKIDAEIVSFLMLTENDQTAALIAKGIGFKKAKDVNSRLVSLASKRIIYKIKCNSQVYWSIEQKSTTKDKSIQAETVLATHGESVIHNGSSDQYCELVNIIQQLRVEILVLKDRVVILEDAQGINIETESINIERLSPCKTPSTSALKNSWSISPSKSPVAKNASCQPPVSSSPVRINNRYGSLAFVNNSNCDNCESDCTLSSNIPQVPDTNKQQINVSKISHRADAVPIVPGLRKHSDVHQNDTVPLVPGLRKYSDVYQNVFSIVTDSTTNRIKVHLRQSG